LLTEEEADQSFNPEDSAADGALAAVVDNAFTWGDDSPPKVPLHDSVIYEVHVKGFTKLHPEIDEKLRGTYAGLGSEPAVRYLRDLGVTAVELLPIHMHVDDRFLVEKDLVNYW